MGKWEYNIVDEVSPLATKTTLIRRVVVFCISDSRCSVVGLKPTVMDDTSGGGFVNRGCCTGEAAVFLRLRLRGLLPAC